jgi:hypothetical protein
MASADAEALDIGLIRGCGDIVMTRENAGFLSNTKSGVVNRGEWPWRRGSGDP